MASVSTKSVGRRLQQNASMLGHLQIEDQGCFELRTVGGQTTTCISSKNCDRGLTIGLCHNYGAPFVLKLKKGQ